MTTSAGSQTIVIVFTSEAKLFTYFFEASDTQSSGFHVLPCTNSLVCGLTRGCEPSSHGTRDGRGCVSDALDHHEARQVHEREVHDDVERNLLDDVDLARGVLELGGERWVAGEALHGREPDLGVWVWVPREPGPDVAVVWFEERRAVSVPCTY